MSAKDGKPPPKGNQPFLGEDDLELDAWDATFDALHTGPESGGIGKEEVMAWPAAAPATIIDRSGVSSRAKPAPEPDPQTFDDFLPGHEPELDEQMTLDHAVEAGRDNDEDFGGTAMTMIDTLAAPPHEIDREAEDALETDFSDVGAAGPPVALGNVLGRHTTGPMEGGDGPTQILKPTLYGERIDPVIPVDEEEVFTSASRPKLPSFEDDLAFDDDAIAPPPPVVAPGPRRPAIVRRTAAIPAEVPPENDFSENTRVANLGEIEGRVHETRSSTATLPPPMADEDAYDDIEIGADSAAAKAPDAPVAGRRTAHVLRRTETPTRPPPAVVEAEPATVIEMDADDAPPPPTPVRFGEEDDFSDVAAAVGAKEQVPAAPEPYAPQRRPSTPSTRVSAPQPVVAPPPAGLEDALDALDDFEPTPLPAVDRSPRATPLPEPARPTRPSQPPEPARTAKPTQPPEPARPSRPSQPPAPAQPESARPPAIVDLYPRVKTPTSVPPIGEPARGFPSEPPRTLISMSPPPASRTLMDMGGAPIPRPAPRSVPPSNVVAEPLPAGAEPALDLDKIARDWPEQLAPLPSATLDLTSAAALQIYEREIATVDESSASAALRMEAGRVCERLADPERARAHYDAALLADPRATPALRGLRRIARASGDLAEATRHLDAELAVAGALERRPLGHYRVDLLMASGDQDLARVAVGELLDSAPSDVRALLAQLELAFLDGRADEFGNALEQLASAVADAELRAALQSARGALAAHHNDTGAAVRWFTAAAESDPSSLAARLGAVRHAAAQADAGGASRALVDLAQQIDVVDPVTAAAAAVRAQQWTASEAAATIATTCAPSDPLVARLAAETAMATLTDATRGNVAAAFAHWASCATSNAERGYAAARAAELDSARGAELWAIVLALDTGDDYAAAQLRTAHVIGERTQSAIDVDLAVAIDIERDRARLRAAYGLIAIGNLDAATDVLATGRAARPGSLAIAEAYGEALAAAGKWSERAKLFAELADHPGEQLDKEVAQLRSALAWEEAVGAAAADASGEQPQQLISAALTAWERVIEQHATTSPTAHAAVILLANRLGDHDVIGEVLARAQLAERSTWAAASLSLRRARLVAGEDPQRGEAVLREGAAAHPGFDDPRRTVMHVLGAARRNELGEAAIALEERAQLIEISGFAGARTGTSSEPAALRLRAAQLFLDAGDAARATTLLGNVETALPHLGVIPDLLAAARRRAGDRPTAASARRPEPASASAGDIFARTVRDADLAAAHGDHAAALALYQRALERRPGDPLASLPLVRIATQLRDPAPLTALALAQLRAAETSGDAIAKAESYELLAQIDGELRDDVSSAQIALESAASSDPSRIDLMHQLERGYAVSDSLGELLRLRRAELETLPTELARDRAALLVDIAGMAARDQRPDSEIADIYRAALAIDPKARLALLHLEAIVRRAGFSPELGELEEKIADYFDGDPRSQAAFWTRAGETLGELGQIDAAVQRFGKAEAALPGHIPALEGWRQAALRGQLWIDVAEAATRQANGSPEIKLRAAFHHFAGVTLMDKALVGEQAMAAFQRALAADPGHKDAFLRLRILLEEDGNHDDLATLLAKRLEVETDPRLQIELHRALAELHRNFLSDRETAKVHFRAILESDPNDLRAYAAVADIAWEQGAWQEAADMLMARARLERAPEVLKTLCYRLGLIYADRLVDIPMALRAFQSALTYQPDDENTLVRLADLATTAGEWKLALGACERLVKQEQDPDRRASHLHRVAKIFKNGFGDAKRAERALNLALDGAPTNDEALQTLVQFYKDAGDMTSARVHLNRVAGAMRARAATDPKDGVAYRVISRAMSARAQTGVDGSLPIARSAAELAELFGGSGEPETKLLATQLRPDLSLLLRPEADEVIFPRGVPPELRQVFQMLGDRVAKHVGVDLRPYGVTRGDRLRARDNPVAAAAQSVATALGFGEIDVYLSTKQPWVMIAEPTSPVSLILGASIGKAGGDAIRFAAGGALKLAQASLAIPARLPVDDLGVLVVALLRLVQPDFPMLALDPDQVAAQMQKLRRLIPSSVLNELKPFALAVDPNQFDHRELARALKVAGLRSGLVASGTLMAGLRILAAQAEVELPAYVSDPVAQGLISFALSEDHAVVAR